MPRARLKRCEAGHLWCGFSRSSEFKFTLLDLAFGLLCIDRPGRLLSQGRWARKQHQGEANEAAVSHRPEREELANEGIAYRRGISLQNLPQTRRGKAGDLWLTKGKDRRF